MSPEEVDLLEQAGQVFLGNMYTLLTESVLFGANQYSTRPVLLLTVYHRALPRGVFMWHPDADVGHLNRILIGY